jgi:hypothetical protein
MFFFGKGVSNKGFKTNKMIQSASTLTESTPYTKLNFKSKNLEEYNRPFSLDELRILLDKAHDIALTESTLYIGQESIDFKKPNKASIDHPFHGFTHATS